MGLSKSELVSHDAAVAFISIGRQTAASARLLMALAAVRTLGDWPGPLYLLTDDPSCVHAFLHAEASCSPPVTCKGVQHAKVVFVDARKLENGAAMGAKSLKALLPVALPHATILYLDADIVVTTPVESIIAAAIAGCTSAICMPVQPGRPNLRAQEPFHTGVILFRMAGHDTAAPGVARTRDGVVPPELDVAAAASALDRLVASEQLPGSQWTCVWRWRSGIAAGQRRRDQQVLGDILAAKDSPCRISAMPAVVPVSAGSNSGASSVAQLLWFPDLSAHSMPQAGPRRPGQPTLPALVHFTNFRLWRLPAATGTALRDAVGLPLAPTRADDTCIGVGRSLPWIPLTARGTPWFRSPVAMQVAEQETLWQALEGVWAPLRLALWVSRGVSDVLVWRQSALEFLDATG